MSLGAAEWAVGDVSAWLEDEGLGRHRRAFEVNGVDGETLVFHITANDLRDELHIASLLDRKKVWNAICRLRQEVVLLREEPPRPRWVPEPLDPLVDSAGSPVPLASAYANYATPLSSTQPQPQPQLQSQQQQQQQQQARPQRPASAPPHRTHQLAPLNSEARGGSVTPNAGKSSRGSRRKQREPSSDGPRAASATAPVGKAEAWVEQRVAGEDARVAAGAAAAASRPADEAQAEVLVNAGAAAPLRKAPAPVTTGSPGASPALGPDPSPSVSPSADAHFADCVFTPHTQGTSEPGQSPRPYAQHRKKSNLKGGGSRKSVRSEDTVRFGGEDVRFEAREGSGEHWSAPIGRHMSVGDLVEYIENPSRRKSYADLLQRKMSTATVATQIHRANQRERELMEAYAAQTAELSDALEHDIIARKKSIFAAHTTIQDWASSAEAALTVNRAKQKFLKLIGAKDDDDGGDGTPPAAGSIAARMAARGEPWWKQKQRESKESQRDRRRREQWAKVLPADKVDYHQLLADQQDLQRTVEASDGVYRKMLEKHEEIQETLRRNLSMLLRVGMNFSGRAAAADRESDEDDPDVYDDDDDDDDGGGGHDDVYRFAPYGSPAQQSSGTVGD